MQRASQDQLSAMVGVEYQLLFVQPNILFVVRKQARSSPSHVTPIADYYIINGHIYQAPDLSNVLSSRLLTAVTNLQSAFDEARGYAKYHPSRGYWWDFDEGKTKSDPRCPQVLKHPISIRLLIKDILRTVQLK